MRDRLVIECITPVLFSILPLFQFCNQQSGATALPRICFRKVPSSRLLIGYVNFCCLSLLHANATSKFLTAHHW